MIKRLIDYYFERKESFLGKKVKKKTYILLAIFTGIIGGHRFYCKQYISAIIYLCTCWLGVSFAMTLMDLLYIIPKKADEDGMVEFVHMTRPDA